MGEEGQKRCRSSAGTLQLNADGSGSAAGLPQAGKEKEDLEEEEMKKVFTFMERDVRLQGYSNA